MISIKETGLFGGIALGLALVGCNSLDKPAEERSNEPRLVIPLDERAAQTAPVTPVPVSGGTLTVLSDGSAAIVADPERDRISIVDLVGTLAVRRTIELSPGDEPGRIVEDAQKHVHVALRHGGAVVSIDALTGNVLERRAVCKAPRGIAFDSATGLLHVACSEGKLVSLPAQGGAAVRTLTLDADLRDVLVRGSELWVTRFKSAQILRVSSLGTLDQRVILPKGQGFISQPMPSSTNGANADPGAGPSAKGVTLEAGTAWRAVSNLAGGAVVVHQDAVDDEIVISPPSASGSSYGGDGAGDGCGGIVRNVVSTVLPDGSMTSTQFMGPPLPVDVAVSTDQRWVAVAHAGVADSFAPRPFMVFPDQGGSSSGSAPARGGASVTIMSLDQLRSGTSCASSETTMSDSQVVSVAFTPNGQLLAQTREPAQLLVMREVPYGLTEFVSLPGESRADTGHDLFHRDAGGGIACASCHAEGGEDGHTWRFSGFGERRTQPLYVGLRDTAPFHWNGDLANVDAVMSEVFVGRMGGVRESAQRVSALSEWLFSLKALALIRDASDEAALRGRELFQSSSVGCTSCHSGAKLTDNRSVAIDTVVGTKLQVPSLVAVGYRAPFMHNGCAKTLAARFDPSCGGNDHGHVAGLSDAQRSDLIAYLESL